MSILEDLRVNPLKMWPSYGVDWPPGEEHELRPEAQARRCLWKLIPAAVLAAMDAIAASYGGGVVVAGGAVLAALVVNMWSNDVDLFLHSFPDSDSACMAAFELLEVLVRGYYGMRPVQWLVRELVFTSRALTIVFRQPGDNQFRKFQIILRNFSSAQAVVECFDLDCCRVFWSQGQFLASYRWRAAVQYGCNLFMPWGSESRLDKYNTRGFVAVFPVKLAGVVHTRIIPAGGGGYQSSQVIATVSLLRPCQLAAMRVCALSVIERNAHISAAEWLGVSDVVLVPHV